MSRRNTGPQTPPVLKQAVADLKQSTTDKANKIVFQIFPQKVIDLHKLYTQDPKFNLDITQTHPDFSKMTQDEQNIETESKKRKMADGSTDNNIIPSNSLIVELIGILKKEILELVEMINTVKLWIQLNIPRIEDGNNFGVSIQEETVNELSRAEDSGFSVMESITKYYVSRGKLVSKLLKYPNIEDYKKCVIELDEKEYINLRMCLLDLQNNYAILYDMIIKNLEKIKSPRPTQNLPAIY